MSAHRPAAALVALAAFIPALAACSSPSQNDVSADSCNEPFTIGRDTNEIWSLQTMVAQSAGFYEKHGITVADQPLFDGTTAEMVQLIRSGEIQTGFTGASAIFATMNSDAPLVMVAEVAVKETDTLPVDPAVITTGTDLQGKSIAINTIGDGTHFSTVNALTSLGVDVGQVTLVPTGGEPDRLAALLSGSVASAVIDRAQREALEQEGLQVLVDLSTSDVVAARHGAVFSASYVETCGPKVQAFVKALADAQGLIMNDPDRAAEVLAEWQGTTPEEAAPLYESMKELLAVQQCLIPNPESFKTTHEFMATQNDSIADVDVTKSYTTQFTDALADEGYFEEIGLTCDGS